MYPCDPNGKPITDDHFVNSPQDLVGSRMDFLIQIPSARNIKWIAEDKTRGIMCRYTFYTDTKKRNTKVVSGSCDVQLNYKKQYTVRSCSETFLRYLEQSALVIEVWGRQGSGRPQRKFTGRNSAARPRHGSFVSDEAAMDAVVGVGLCLSCLCGCLWGVLIFALLLSCCRLPRPTGWRRRRVCCVRLKICSRRSSFCASKRAPLSAYVRRRYGWESGHPLAD